MLAIGYVMMLVNSHVMMLVNSHVMMLVISLVCVPRAAVSVSHLQLGLRICCSSDGGNWHGGACAQQYAGSLV